MAGDNESKTAIALVDPLVGTIFDKRFRIEERIAAGGFGAIYRATHVKSGHPIALKVLLPLLAQDLGIVARFRREGDTLTALRNPHTITAYELGQAGDRTLFIVMELLSGQSLFERYEQNGPFEWRRMARIARQVCESLDEAHARGIVHRDLKPTNIHLENVDGDPDFVKVLDFGIAKILGGSDFDASDITNAGTMIGTLDYMSPEQMVGGQVTGQTDIYTLGIVMYEMIAGVRPFPEAVSAASALGAMLKTTPQPLYLRAPVPEQISKIVMRCLEREMQRRYRSVADLVKDLDEVIGEGGSANVVLDATKTFKPDDEATAFTPPPEKLLRELRTPSAARMPEWEDEDEQATTLGGDRHADRAPSRAETNVLDGVDPHGPTVAARVPRNLDMPGAKTPTVPRNLDGPGAKTPTTRRDVDTGGAKTVVRREADVAAAKSAPARADSTDLGAKTPTARRDVDDVGAKTPTARRDSNELGAKTPTARRDPDAPAGRNRLDSDELDLRGNPDSDRDDVAPRGRLESDGLDVRAARGRLESDGLDVRTPPFQRVDALEVETAPRPRSDLDDDDDDGADIAGARLSRTSESRSQRDGVLSGAIDSDAQRGSRGTSATRPPQTPDAAAQRGSRGSSATRPPQTPDPDAPRSKSATRPPSAFDADAPRPKSGTRPPPTPDPDAAGPRGKSASAPPPIAPTPPVRPLQARNYPTPVPQVVVAPFSSTPRAKTAPPTGMPTPPPGSLPPGVPMPPMRQTPFPGAPPMGSPTNAPPNAHVPTPPGMAPYGAPNPNPFAPNAMPGSNPAGNPFAVPGSNPSANPFAVPGSNPAANPFAVPGSNPAANPFSPPAPQSNPFLPSLPPAAHPVMPRPQYDMGHMAAREAMIRRVVWIIALVVAAAIGFIIAMRF
ncbi:MAG TPA: protein kinase [Kofleriaceae bacterium]|nr:protein kinase [Kofleriaceae bacterium]